MAEQTLPPTELEKKPYIGATEKMYIIGLALLFFGLWLWVGLGIALSVCGAVLIASAILNSLLLSVAERDAANAIV